MNKYFQAYYTATLPNGEKKQFKFRGKTQKEANAKRDEAKLLCEHGLLTFNNKTPLRRYSEEFFKTYIEPQNSRKNAACLWKMYDEVVLSKLGHLPVSSIKKTQLAAAFNTMSDRSSSYYKKVFGTTKRIFANALSDGLIITDPSATLTSNAKATNHRRALTEAERAVIFPILMTDTHYIFFSIMLACGLRPNEVRALCWGDIDWEDQKLNVSRAFKVDGEIGTPKTKSGIRSIPMPTFLCELLKEYKETNGETLYLFSKCFAYYEKLWKKLMYKVQIAAGAKTDAAGEIIIYAENIGREITPYYLRHTFATMLCENSIPIKLAQKYMGHSNASMIMEIYSHASDVMEKQSQEKMKNLFSDSVCEVSAIKAK